MKGRWEPASNGARARRWFLYRDAERVRDRYHFAAGGRLIRYASYASATKAADKLNEKR